MERIKQRKDGRYEIKIYLGNIDGKDKYKSVYGKTQKEVKAKALDVKLKLGKGIDMLTSSNSSFSYWSNAWLSSIERVQSANNFHALTVSAKTLCNYVGEESIVDITIQDCQDVLSDIAMSNPRYPNRQSSAKTIKEYHSVLTRVFNFAIQNRAITFNPSIYAIEPKGVKKQTRKPLTNEQIRYFRETEHQLQLCAMIMIYAGLRRGEALALTWNDIDLERRIINIDKSIDLKQNGKIKEPKTEAGYRQVPIPDVLYEYLSKSVKKSGYVVSDKNKPLTNNKWLYLWREYIDLINDKYCVELKTSAHCLRHTYCTMLNEAGVDLVARKSFMGHSSTVMTMDNYTHLRDEQMQLATKTFNEYSSNL